MDIAQPTPAQCSTDATLSKDGPVLRFATWHPQWGGYVGQAIVEVHGPGGCFEVFVWHDGEFPYDDKPPLQFHYCNPIQLIRLALKVIEKQIESGDESTTKANRDDVAADLRRMQEQAAELIEKLQ